MNISGDVALLKMNWVGRASLSTGSLKKKRKSFLDESAEKQERNTQQNEIRSISSQAMHLQHQMTNDRWLSTIEMDLVVVKLKRLEAPESEKEMLLFWGRNLQGLWYGGLMSMITTLQH